MAFCIPTSLPAAATQQVAAKRGANITTIAYEMGFWNQKLRFALSDASAVYDFVESPVLGATPGPMWITGVKQGGAIRCYINASLQNSAASGANLTNTTAGFRIGQDDSGLPFVGVICEVAVWAKAFSLNEIAAIVNGVSPLFVRRAQLRGYWPVWGAGSPEVDLSGFKNNAALVGAPSLAHHRGGRKPLRHLPFAA